MSRFTAMPTSALSSAMTFRDESGGSTCSIAIAITAARETYSRIRSLCFLAIVCQARVTEAASVSLEGEASFSLVPAVNESRDSQGFSSSRLSVIFECSRPASAGDRCRTNSSSLGRRCRGIGRTRPHSLAACFDALNTRANSADPPAAAFARAAKSTSCFAILVRRRKSVYQYSDIDIVLFSVLASVQAGPRPRDINR